MPSVVVMTTTRATPALRTTTPSPKLLLAGGILLAIPGLVALSTLVLPESPAAVTGPVLESIAGVLLAVGRIGGRSALAKTALIGIAVAYAILIVAIVLASSGNAVELLFPLGGTLLTLAFLVAGIEIARVGAVGGYARWGMLVLGVWQLLIALGSFAALSLPPLVTPDGPGVAGDAVGAALLLAEGIAIIVASRGATPTNVQR